MTEEHLRKRRYLAIFLPFLPTQRLQRIFAKPVEQPFALIEKQRGALYLTAVDERAQKLGLTAGLKFTDARARVPDLVTFEHEIDRDEALLRDLADWCQRYTPMVEQDHPHALILDISGCTHFFAGGETGLANDLEGRLADAGFSLRWATATTADAALALARYGLKEGRAADLPVAALRVQPKVQSALERAGLRSIGELAKRPRAGLAARFGREVPVMLDRLLGKEDRHITPQRPVADIMLENRFAEPITHVDAVHKCLENLLGQAAEQLLQRGQGARNCRISLYRCDGHAIHMEVETGAPTRDAELIMRLLHERIDALNDPLDPGFGYDLIRLHIMAAQLLGAKQLWLENEKTLGNPNKEQEQADEDIAALTGQLSIRMGKTQVQRFAPVDSHIPEQAVLAFPAINSTRRVEWQKPVTSEPPLRPLHLFDPPQHIKVIAAIPDGPPRQFRWRRKLHHITRYEGPERISPEWWRRKQGHEDGKAGLSRDYYRVEDVRGRRYWLFRHGLYGAEKANPDWYIHGLFA